MKVRPVFEKNCVFCHNEETRSGGLSFGARQDVLKGGGRGPAVLPGNPDASLILRAIRHEGDLKMPPTGKLPEADIATLTEWVRQGAPWSQGELTKASSEAGHWSFRPVRKPDPPDVSDTVWARHPIDRFILARLMKEGLTPSPEADRRVLIRRVSLDLTGLPPKPEEVQAFLADDRPDAYESLVDRLLASPHYGERWGRHWLDVARYADSNGYNLDAPRSIWMYRDWVINALNRDMPFDQFVIEQMAGDLLPNATKDQIVATGFHRNTLLNLEGGIDFEQYRVEAVVDRAATTGGAFLGLTVGCARCHDHKYDPISQKEFYQLYAFFNDIDELSGEFKDEEGRARPYEPLLEFGTPEELTRRDAIRGQAELLEKELAEYEKTLPKQAEWEARLSEEERKKLGPELTLIFDLPLAERNDFQKQAAARAFKNADPGYAARRKGIQALRSAEPEIKSTLVMRDLPQPRQAYVHRGGDFLAKGEEVEPGVPSVLPPLPPGQGRYSRLDLARWLVDPANPLTARVTVNRVWQRYFGKGLVETENDFGTQGSMPSHPELLDWLAAEFIEQGWSLKKLHRLIVTSATYRQASQARPELDDADPRNRLLARQNRLRLEAEIVRDSALVASGLFTDTIGGPSVFPPQPEGAERVTQVDRKWTAATGPERYRRGMYTWFWRSAPHPGLMVFDAPDSMTSCTRRNRSNTPLQALTLLNDEAHSEFAQGLAARVLREAPASRDERLDYLFEVCLARRPKPREQTRLEEFLARQLDDFQTSPDKAENVLTLKPREGIEAPQWAAWTSVSRVLLNLDEFITRE
jgi:hypothetical protein